jgi:hypothetical protein
MVVVHLMNRLDVKRSNHMVSTFREGVETAAIIGLGQDRGKCSAARCAGGRRVVAGTPRATEAASIQRVGN